MGVYKFERAKKICDDLKSYITVQSLVIDSFKVKEGFFLTPQDVDKDSKSWLDYNCNTDFWHGPDSHYWFRTTFTVPENFNKKALWLNFVTQATFWDAVNPQFLLFINNEMIQGLDANHQEVRLFDKAKAGETITIDLQAYTGRDNDHNQGSTANLRLFAHVNEVNEHINDAYYNLYTVNRIVEHLEKDNLSKIKLQSAIEKAINILDLRVPYSKEFYDSIDECNKFMKSEIYTKLAGNDDVVATCIGHTHIDIAWWWTVEQTREKVIRSFATVLKLMDEYKDYKFMSSQPQLYKFVKQRYPEMYEKIKKRIKEGRWETEGGMWLEADCNVTSGESLVRQFLHGKKFFKDEFGNDNKILWLPDVFGYSAALPQIMRKSGIEYFITTKIAWNQFNKLPMDTFNWRGIDSSEVLTHLVTTQDINQPADSFYTTYNGNLNPISVMRAWDRYQNKEINNDVLISYGYGDGGGGSTREMVETGLRMEKGIIGAPKVRMETATKYFEELKTRCGDSKDLPTWVGELYLEYHRGTYTSMARNKRSNRKCELLWQDVEFFSVLAKEIGLPYDAEQIYNSWETILLNQFHDILPGSSIHEVYEVTKAEYTDLETRGANIISEKLSALANATTAKKDDLVVFNSLSFDREDTVIVTDDEFSSATAFIDSNGNHLPASKTADGYICFTPIIVPAKGYATFTPVYEVIDETPRFTINENKLETPFYNIEFDKSYQFTSIFDKDADRELIKNGEKANAIIAYEDKPIYYDNWDIDIYYDQKSWAVDNVKSAIWEEFSPVRAVLKITREFLQSTIIQKIIFYANNRRIDFETYVDWKQFNILLKTEFPVDINTHEATYDIQFGNIKRPTHKNTSWNVAQFEVCAHKWADLSEGGYGVALLNDCKYGYGITDNKMTLTLLKSGTLPNPVTDQEEHWFTYAILPHTTNSIEEVQKEGYCLNIPAYTVIAGAPVAKLSSDCMISLDIENVIIETIKEPIDKNGTIIRMYEYQNCRTPVTITLDYEFKIVEECNLLEEKVKEVAINASEFTFTIKPFEIKTFRIIK